MEKTFFIEAVSISEQIQKQTKPCDCLASLFPERNITIDVYEENKMEEFGVCAHNYDIANERRLIRHIALFLRLFRPTFLPTHKDWKRKESIKTYPVFQERLQHFLDIQMNWNSGPNSFSRNGRNSTGMLLNLIEHWAGMHLDAVSLLAKFARFDKRRRYTKHGEVVTILPRTHILPS